MAIKSGIAACTVALGTIGTLGLGTGAAHAVLTPYGCAAPTLGVDDTSPFRGQLLHVELTCYLPNKLIDGTMASTPVHVFSVKVDGIGHAFTTARVPQDFTCGPHRVIGTDSTDPTDSAFADINVRGCGERDHDHDHDHPCNCGGGGGGAFGGYEDDDEFDSSGHRIHHSLPRTGAEVLGIGLTATALVTAGSTIVVRRRRKR